MNPFDQESNRDGGGCVVVVGDGVGGGDGC